ncbi:hypothetical protein ANMWB30_24800 [Arthrobacter sp. MWB30]|nr:hypothetical protein ANMWB30_24800 [Arthrobacter sp. MWB30]
MTADRIAALLEPIQNRLNAATPGPWVEYHENGTPGVLEAFNCPPATGVYLVDYASMDQKQKDAQFFANAPTDLARVLAAIEGLVELHEPVLQRQWGPHRPMCRHDSFDWPCPTVTAIESALSENP